MLSLFALGLAGAWSLVLGGDIMLNGIPAGTGPFDGIADVVRGADLAIANLEIPLTTSRAATTRKTAAELKARSQFILKADPAHASHIAAVGWDLVSLGNNHSMDYGPEGLEEMLAALKANRLGWTGAGKTRLDAKRASLAVLPDGQRVSLVSMLAYRTNGALWKCWPATEAGHGLFDLGLAGQNDEAVAARLRGVVQSARKRGEFVVVALHWGVERTTVPDAHQVRLGRAFIDAGADVVVGHHPHVLQGAELYRGKPILYSTGNLVSPLPSNTALFRLTFAQGRLATFEALPCRISGGKTKWLPAAQVPAAAKGFDALCRALAKKYPHPSSAALGAGWRAGPP